ncbi:MAG: alpha-2-macroglobulin family protein, partial [Saprospiraceae bacterium]
YWDGRVDHPIERTHREKIFPYYESNATNGISGWEIDKKMIDQTFQTKDAIDIISKIGAGAYKIEMEAKDKYERDVTDVHYFVLTDFEKSTFPKSDFLFTKINMKSLQPGQSLELTAGVADKPIWMQVLIEKNGELLYSQTSKTDKLSKINFPITEQYRGGLTLKIGYVIQNRFFQNSYNVSVPWTNKELDITYETFRDKTLPGSKEEYRIKIKGRKAEKVAAEMVAAMYDASLDQFAQHQWRTSFYPSSYGQLRIEAPGFSMVQGQYYQYSGGKNIDVKPWVYPSLIPLIQYHAIYQSRSRSQRGEMHSEDMMVMKSAAPEQESMLSEVATTQADENKVETVTESTPKPAEPLIRKNLNETVFFFPSLKTDTNGDIILSFTINEALTKWKLMSFAHTTDFMTGYDERIVQTQKNLMIFPNAPRFMRDGDVLSFSAKVSNLTSATLTGTAKLQFFDAITMKDVTAEVLKSPNDQPFNAVASGSQGLSWDVAIPDTKFTALTYRITAEAGGHSDGEENTLPVVTNQMLVTEAMPMWIKGNETKTFTFDAFKNNKSLTKKDVRYTVEYTSNPVWYAIQALPYMNSPNNVSTLALMDMMYANVLATKIANSHPKIKAVFDQWAKTDKNALLSNLSKNEDLKNAVLEETPWVRQSLSEAEQKRNLALLFDLNQLADQKAVSLAKLSERQLSNGGFPWIAGGRDDCYSTQHILESIGHLSHLGALDTKDSDWQNIISNGLKYMDDRLIDRYNRLLDNISRYGGNLDDNHLDALSIHYLYIRTFYKDVQPSSASDVARNYYFGQAKKYWLKQGLYTQAMIGLIMHRSGDPTTQNIIKSLQERSFSNDEMGMYWNEGNGFYWYQLPIERQAMMIEFFGEAQSDADQVSKMKIWLLKNKQTNHWNTSKSSAAAIYALLLQSEKNGISTWVTENVAPTITIGKDQWIMDSKSVEAGTGYAKKSFDTGAINKDMATIKITNPNTSVAWGAAYYQYFERLDQVKKFSDNPLNIDKKLYKVSRSDKGDVLDEVDNKTTLKPGDKLKIRIVIRVDREMEYVHMKDMRPSGIEPISVISEHKYQGQLSYYESTRDLATHFYFGYLPKGTFVFEYPVSVVHKGDFSGGVTTIECMYAPEFNSHSQGQRVVVKTLGKE